MNALKDVVRVSRLLGGQGDLWFHYEAWSDWDDREDRRGSDRVSGTLGYRLKLEKNALRTLLVREDLDLIAEISIEKRLENQYGKATAWDDKERRRKTRKGVVLRKSGQIEDIGGCIGTWF